MLLMKNHKGTFSQAAIVACMSVIVAAISVSAQSSKSLPERVADLERRVNALEQQLTGASAATAATPSYQSAPTTSAVQSSRTSGASPLRVQLLTKKVQPAGPGEASDQLGFLFEFTNDGNKDITAISGDIVLKSLAAEELLVFSFNTSNYLAAKGKISWYGGIPYKPADAIHKRVLSMPIDQIVAQLNLDQIVYSDATIQSFK
jgi:hypothetical protein